MPSATRLSRAVGSLDKSASIALLGEGEGQEPVVVEKLANVLQQRRALEHGVADPQPRVRVELAHAEEGQLPAQ